MKDQNNPSHKLRVIFSLSANHIATLNELAMKSNRSRSGVIAMLVELAGRNIQIRTMLGGGL